MRRTRDLLWIAMACAYLLYGCDSGGGNDGEEATGGEQETTGGEQETAPTQPPPPVNHYAQEQPSPQQQVDRHLRNFHDGALAYFDREWPSEDGYGGEHYFPGSVPRTPAEVPCGEPVDPNPDDWQHPTWRSLRFAPTQPLYYSYQFDSSGQGIGSTFTASAFGDLDCDGELSTFFRTGTAIAYDNFGGFVDLQSVNPSE